MEIKEFGEQNKPHHITHTRLLYATLHVGITEKGMRTLL